MRTSTGSGRAIRPQRDKAPWRSGIIVFMTKRRRPSQTPPSTCTAIVPTRSAEEEAWHDLQVTIRKRRLRIRKLQQEIRPLEEALARFERNYRVKLGGLQEELRRLRAEVHTLESRAERIHARIASDPQDELGDLFTPEELEEIGKFFDQASDQFLGGESRFFDLLARQPGRMRQLGVIVVTHDVGERG